MIPNFRAFNKETKKMYGVDGFELSVRKIYRCSLNVLARIELDRQSGLQN